MATTNLKPHIVHETSYDFNQTRQSNLNDIGVKTLWEAGYTGKGMVAAILDTGVDDSHLALSGKVITGKNFTSDWNNDSTKYTDNNGHGTWCGGAICGNGDQFKGVAPDAQLIVGKVLDSKGGGTYDQIKAGLAWVRDWRNADNSPVDVVSMSLGGAVPDPEIVSLIDQLNQLGILVICAAGNAGDGNGTTNEVDYPADYPQTLSVGAYDGYGGVAKFSDSNNEVMVIAPGVGVWGCWINQQYSAISGTSMATPQVAGMGLLLKQKYGLIGAWAVYNALTKHTKPIAAPVTEQGNGLIFADAANLKATVAPPEFYMSFQQAAEDLDSPQYWINAVQTGVFKKEYVELEIRKFSQKYHDVLTESAILKAQIRALQGK